MQDVNYDLDFIEKNDNSYYSTTMDEVVNMQIEN